MEEERVPYAGDPKDDPSLSIPLPPPHPPPFPVEDSETYIVQIPRDQIYRVPPPENAVIAESYRNPLNKKSRCGNRRCLWISTCLTTVALIIGIIVVLLHLFSSPQTPGFSITKVLVKNPQPSQNHHNSHPSYIISLKAHNPNDGSGVSYENGGSSLFFKQHKIAEGSSPLFSQKAKESTTVPLTLAGSNGVLPSEIKKSLNHTKSKTPVSLSLKINVPIKLKSLIITSNKDVTITCDFKVNTLATGTRILSQQCHT